MFNLRINEAKLTKMYLNYSRKLMNCRLSTSNNLASYRSIKHVKKNFLEIILDQICNHKSISTSSSLDLTFLQIIERKSSQRTQIPKIKVFKTNTLLTDLWNFLKTKMLHLKRKHTKEIFLVLLNQKNRQDYAIM